MPYKRSKAHKAIIMALRDVGGTASRAKIKQLIAENDKSGFTYEDVFQPKVAKSGNKYIPFNFDFNFGLRELAINDYVEPLKRGVDVVLTEKGRTADYEHFPSASEKKIIDKYWASADAARKARTEAQQKKQQNEVVKVDSENDDIVDTDENDDVEHEWGTQLLEQLKHFSPQKFESFSRLLISKMGVQIDSHLGKVMSSDHGLDGFGYFESDEFRTSRVAIQAKRYDDNPVGEPEIDKFKGAMDGFNAEYGIFITTSRFTDSAKKKAIRGSKSVTLIDGQRIIELVEKYMLHITPVNTFSLDNYYFEQD